MIIRILTGFFFLATPPVSGLRPYVHVTNNYGFRLHYVSVSRYVCSTVYSKQEFENFFYYIYNPIGDVIRSNIFTRGTCFFFLVNLYKIC